MKSHRSRPRYRLLSLALCCVAAGWAQPPDGWRLSEEGLVAATADPGRFLWQPVEGLWPVGLVELRVRTQDNPAHRGLGLGLSWGDPQPMQRRAMHLAFQAGGQLAWFDGAAWVDLLPYPAATDLTVRLILDSLHGDAQVELVPADGQAVISPRFPFWNQIGAPDTFFLNNYDPSTPGATEAMVRSFRVVSEDPRLVRPELSLERWGAAAVRLRWRAVAPTVAGLRLWRNGAILAELPADATSYLDREVEPQTRYEYLLEAVGAGLSRPAGCVTGPPNEARSLISGRYEVVVYGATPAGIAAAITAAERGRRVALIEPGDFVGGMVTGGLSRTDFGSIHALGGLFKRFMGDVVDVYTRRDGPDSINVRLSRGGLYFEPHVAREIFLRWLAVSPGVTLFRRCHLVGVTTTDGRVNQALFLDRDSGARRAVSGTVFIDATYEADLAAYAGASYLLGREAKDEFGEAYAGRLWWDVWQRRVVEVPGDGDRVVQAYNYRLTMTRDVRNRLPAPPPRHYNRNDYVGLLPDIRNGRLNDLKEILSILQLPGGKADANNHPQGDPSSDLVGGADTFPEADHAERLVIADRHRDHILGLLWFLRFDDEVPVELRDNARDWGLCRDEFPEVAGWPSQLYVREARRIWGDSLFTEHDAMAQPGGVRPPGKRDSIAVGAYPIDSHATGGRHPVNRDWLEGFFYLARGETQPYQISYGIMLPQRIEGLIVCCGGISSTHVGYGTLRMEPVFMGLGLAAGLAADHALAENVTPRQVNLQRLQLDLLAADQVITVFTDLDHATPGWAGFNLLGTLGLFADYEARPTEPLTDIALRSWLAALPWPSWSATAAQVTETGEPVPPAQLRGLLAGLARRHAVRPPVLPDAGDTITRGEAMAALWQTVSPWLDRQR